MLCKIKIIIFYVVIILNLFSFNTIQAKDIKICDNCEIKSITKAINLAENGDILIINGGYYKESPIVIDKSITVKGVGFPVIDGEKKESVIKIISDNVIIDSLFIINGGRNQLNIVGGIHTFEVNNCVIKNSLFKNNNFAIYLGKVNNCLVENNLILGTNEKSEVLSGNGVHSWYSNNIKIKKNIIRGHRDGLYLESSEETEITDNYSLNNNRYGLHFMFCHGSILKNNRFSDNSAGVVIMYTYRVEALENIFQNNERKGSLGILIKDIGDSVFKKNKFYKTTRALVMDNSNRNHFEENIFYFNGISLIVLGSCDSNKFINNNFLFNFFDVMSSAYQNLNNFTENYWSRYQGYDLDFDGIGDKPFHPMQYFGYLVSNYSELSVLLLSPIIEFLEVAERAFPVITPINLVDNRPRMKATAYAKEVENL